MTPPWLTCTPASPRRTANPPSASSGAQAQGLVPPESDLELLLDQLAAPFFYRRLIAHRPIPPSMATAVVNQTLTRR
jgi:hypothetical protein